MFFDYDSFSFYIKPEYIDMRKGIPGLSLYIQEMMRMNPFSENTMFLFCCKSKKLLKALVWGLGQKWILANDKEASDGVIRLAIEQQGSNANEQK